MKLTAKGEYGLLAMVFLSRRNPSGYVAVEEIAAAQKIPRRYLSQILLTLKRAHYLHSCKGHNGGFRLAKPASKITLAELIRLLDGPLAPTASVSRYFYERTPIAREKALTKVFQGIRDFVSRELESTTLADVS